MNITVACLMTLSQSCVFIFCIPAHSNSTIYAVEGKNVIILCPLWSTTSVVSWTGPQNVTYSINGVVNENILHSHKISVVGDKKKGEYNLLIERLLADDFGLYQCESMVNGTFAVHDICLKKAEPPKKMKIWNITDDGFKHVSEGEQFILNCSIEPGIPASTMSWRFNDISLNIKYETTYITYQLEAKRAYNMHQFYCVADNELFMLNKSICILVYLLPEVNVYFKPDSKLAETENVTLICKSTSNVSPFEHTWIFEDNNIVRQNTTTFTIVSAGRKDTGKYTCRVRNWVGFGENSTFVQILYKPQLDDMESSHTHFAEHGKPTGIQIRVGSYELPSVAWTTNPGGKVGSWNVQNISEAFYHLSSIIIPTSNFHYGVYGIRVRNSIGQINLEVKITSVVVYLTPQHTSCNISSHITLVCTVKSRNFSELSNEWIHVSDNTILRSLKGVTEGSTSILSVHYCDYRDMGEYICKWSTREKVYSNQSTVLVEGQPVFANAKLKESSSGLQMKVVFYSVPSPSRVIWFFKDRLVQNESANLQILTSERISIDLHKRQVSVHGFVASLETKRYNYSISKLFSCQIQNTYGILDISLSNMRFSNPTVLNGKYIRTGTLERKFDNKTVDGNTIQNNEDTELVKTYLYSGGTATFTVLMLMIAAAVVRFKALKRKVHSIEEVTGQDQEGTEAEPNDDQLSDQTYEEVENVSYQSVEWRNYDVDMHSSENESIHLHEVQEQHYENESDLRCYEDLSSLNRAPNEYAIIERNLEERSKSESDQEIE